MLRAGLLIAVWVVAGSASAQPRPLVTLAVDRADDPVAARLRAELDALGFEVETIEAPGQAPSRPLLEATARDRGAIAAMRIVPSRAGVEVWIFDRVTGKTVLREVVTDPNPARPDFETVALRTVELLRASLMEIDAPHPSRGEVRPPPAARAIAHRRRAARRGPRTSLAVGPTVALSPPRVVPALDLLAAVRLAVSGPIGGTIVALVPLIPARVDDPEGVGHASVLVALLGADLSFRLPGTRRLQPDVGTGAAMVLLHMTGSASERGFVGTTDDTLSALPYLRGGARLGLWRGIGLVAEALIGLAIPQPSIRFAGREVAVWGAPLITATLGLDLTLQ